MAAAPENRQGRKRNAALKDSNLIYRACTDAFVQALPIDKSALPGKTDFDFLPEPVARVYRSIEQEVLETGVPVVSSGRLSQSQSDDLVVVRSPVIADSGDITGVELNVLNLTELRADYAELLTRDFEHRNLFSHFPFAVWVHRGATTIYQNRRWRQLTTDQIAEIEHWLQSGQPEGFSADGSRYFQHCSIRSHGAELHAVFCFQQKNGADNFVEKRRGARRDWQLFDGRTEEVAQTNVEQSLFKAIKFPLIVCDNSWQTLYSNDAAKLLMEHALVDQSPQGNGQSAGSVEHWFNDREKADIDTMMRQRELVDMPLVTSIEFSGRNYMASVSPANWSGRSALLITLQHNARQQQLYTELGRLQDFVSAGGDFQWEMDSEQHMTYLSVDLKPLTGVDNSQLIGKPLSAIVEQHVDTEDMAQWSVLSVDMRNQLAFREREFKWKPITGEKRVVRLSGVPVFDDAGNFLGYRGTGVDYTQAYNTATTVAFHASHDSLTGLVNRREFEQRCDDAIFSARESQVTHALCFMDLDNFKIVNDTSGHLAGDELLRQLSALFSSFVRKSDVLARLGGDEFAVLVYDVGVNEVLRLANQLRSEVESFQFLWEDKAFNVGVSIGVVIIDSRWEDRPALFGAADAACYEAKNLGRNTVSVYTDKQTASGETNSGATWVERINSAVEEKRVRLCMQKILALDSYDQAVTRVELLMRIMEQSQPIVPFAFMPAADRYGLTVKLDKAVVERAIDWLEGQPHVTDEIQLCSINLHSRSFADEDFTVFLINALESARFDVSILCFEITETAVIANLTGATQFMKRVGETGCKFALDDFGSGLSSFSYLKNLPVSYLKIDGKFVRNILQEPVDYAMVKAINEIGQTLGKKIIAEFVESEEVLEKLREIGVDLAQGYQIGKPELIDF